MTGYSYHDDLSLTLHRVVVRLMTEDFSLVDDAQATLERWMEGGDPHTPVLWNPGCQRLATGARGDGGWTAVAQRVPSADGAS